MKTVGYKCIAVLFFSMCTLAATAQYVCYSRTSLE
jgi:hypothetical protein